MSKVLEKLDEAVLADLEANHSETLNKIKEISLEMQINNEAMVYKGSSDTHKKVQACLEETFE